MKRITILGAVLCLAHCGYEAFAQQGCTDERCYPPRQCYRTPPPGAYCPPNPRPETPDDEADTPSGAFVAPPPTGETVGAANSVGLRLGSIKIPEITIPLPTLRLPHLVHYKRSPEVILDKAIAGYQQNADIMDFAQIPPQSEDEADTPTEDEPDTPGPQCPPPAQAPPCYPPHRYCPPEGCTDLMEQQGNGGAWQSAEMYELTKKQRQVAELKSQVSELKQLVDQLARQRAQDTVVAPENKPIKPVGFERPDRNLGEYCAPLRTTPAGPPSPSVNEQVSRMQHQIDALIAAQSTQNQPSSPDGVKTSAEPDQQVPQEAKTRGKGSVLARFKNYFHRG